MSGQVAVRAFCILLNFQAVICISTFSTVFILAQINKLTPRILTISLTIALFGRSVCGFVKALLNIYEAPHTHYAESLFEAVNESFYSAVMMATFLALIERITASPLLVAVYVRYRRVDLEFPKNAALPYVLIALAILSIVLSVQLDQKKRKLLKLSERQVSLRFDLADTVRNTQPVLATTVLLTVILTIQHVVGAVAPHFSETENILFALYTNFFPLVFVYRCPSVLKHFPSLRKWVIRNSKAKLHPAYRCDSVWVVGIGESYVYVLDYSSVVRRDNEMASDDCHKAYLSQTTFGFIAIQGFVFVLDAVGLCLLAFLLVSVIKTKIFHVNLRILIVSYTFALVCRSTLTLYRSAAFVINRVTFKEECDFLNNKYQCLVVSVFGIAFSLSAYSSLLSSALERIYACLRSKVYERSKNPLIGIVFALLSWASVGWFTVHFIPDNDPGHFKSQQTLFCNSQMILTETNFPFGVEILYVVFIAVAVYIGLYVYTRRRKRHFPSENLSHRYQIVENLRSTQVILLVALGMLTPTVIVIAGSIALQFSSVDLTLYAIYKEILSLPTPIYIVFYPLIFAYKCPELLRTWRKKPVSVVASTHLNYASTQTYFRQLESMWEGSASR
ncbi:hypothetical protein QR680_018024 [Steinernema hermaphroditum]|uniref:G-protein coupled receptors family 1 profile domain-containing protein n=1 Tax=Steinernema hermaphroditum TaxID=289476 RepID=A0AA39HGN4_9BILA|nr:hypothetical protein QR680_018024 [Steinernema hermaphroditum]